MNLKPLVYIAGPMGRPSPEQPANVLFNAARAYDVAERLRFEGIDCFVPHGSTFVSGAFDWTYENYIEWDFNIISRCDALVRIPGTSPGADREVEFARKNNILTFVSFEDKSIDDLIYRVVFYFKSRKNRRV